MLLLPHSCKNTANGWRMRPHRNMGTPVFTELPLINFSASPTYRAALPLMPPSHPSRTQALQLATNGDVLVGRADNGETLGTFWPPSFSHYRLFMLSMLTRHSPSAAPSGRGVMLSAESACIHIQ